MCTTSCQGKEQTKLLFADCPKCGEEIEYNSSDTVGICPNCGHKILNEKMQCVFTCENARQCVGDEAYELAMQASDRISFDPEKFKHFTRW